MKYDVTIGIPVYKSENYIRKTIESALSQDYQSIEFLIVDDFGCDGSLSIIHDLLNSHPRKDDVHIIYHTFNKGVSASRNDIIDNANGEYLYFLDSDDMISSNTISILMDNIHKYNAEIVFGSYEKIEISREKTIYQYPSLQLLGGDQLACFAYRRYGGIQASACNFLVKTSMLRDHHLRFIETDYWEDLVFTFELVPLISRAVLLPIITYTYVCHEDSLSHYQGRTQITKEEVLKNVKTIDYLKRRIAVLFNNKVYFPNMCYIVLMTDFYIACHTLKCRSVIKPPILNAEIKAMMSHPASLWQICSFYQGRIKNLFLFLLGKMPAFLCVFVIRCLGKLKKLV